MSTSVSRIVESSLVQLDDDTREYISSLLEDDPSDDEAREAVAALIEGSVDEDAEELCSLFFGLLDASTTKQGGGSDTQSEAEGRDGELRKLEGGVRMKESDVQTFASGLVANHDDIGGDAHKESAIAAFYANMIDISGNEAAVSERARRKQRQKEIRERMEEEERQRAIQEAMAMFETPEGESTDDMMEKASDDNAADVHLRNFDLPNLRGGGPNLLQNANLTLSKGRRYGLIGVNGCGKSTFMAFFASRQVPGIPRNLNMLLVRQEIIGNEWSAVKTVLKSDVKRESVGRFIRHCEEELERLDREENGQTVSGEKEQAAEESKGRQKLRDRKKQLIQKAARKKAAKTTQKSREATIQAKRTKLTEQLARGYERLSQIEAEEGGDPEPRARKVLSGLGFSTEMQDKPTQELSGGWRMRVSLSCALFASPSLLMLDEPTNHIDLEAVLWLEKYLTNEFKGTLVVVSHDRHFLNEVVTDVVHFNRQQLTTYRGDISSFEAVRADERQRQIRLREIQESKRAHLQKYIDLHAQAGENGVKAARQRKSKMKKLDKLGVMAQDGKKWKASYDGDAEEVEEYKEEEEVVLKFPDPGAFDGDIIRLEQVSFGYDEGKTLLHDIDLNINIKSRVALLGRNGSGKSTLIKLAVGALQPGKGKVVIDSRAKIEYLAQHQLEQLDPDGTPLQTMIDRYPGDRSNSHIAVLRRYLANFGLGGEVLPVQKIHTMSGGQKCRLCLASAMYRRPHMLVLDEPSNHLDFETTEALIEAIRTFPGGVIMVSHDQHLLTSVCKDMLVMENGHLQVLRHGMSNAEAFNAYKKAVLAGRR